MFKAAILLVNSYLQELKANHTSLKSFFFCIHALALRKGRITGHCVILLSCILEMVTMVSLGYTQVFLLLCKNSGIDSLVCYDTLCLSKAECLKLDRESPLHRESHPWCKASKEAPKAPQPGCRGLGASTTSVGMKHDKKDQASERSQEILKLIHTQKKPQLLTFLLTPHLMQQRRIAASLDSYAVAQQRRGTPAIAAHVLLLCQVLVPVGIP